MNKVIGKLTNRNSGFVSELFQNLPYKIDPNESDDLKHIRRLMCLDKFGVDYYLVGILSALEAHPNIYEKLKEFPSSFDLKHYKHPEPRIVGANLVGDANGDPFFEWGPDTLPVVFKTEVKHIDANRLMVTHGDLSQYTPYRTRETRTLFLDWPESLNIQGGLLLNEDFNFKNYTRDYGYNEEEFVEGVPITIHYVPRRFPYGLMYYTLVDDTKTNRLLQDTGLLPAFHMAHTPTEGVAVAALALCLSTNID